MSKIDAHLAERLAGRNPGVDHLPPVRCPKCGQSNNTWEGGPRYVSIPAFDYFSCAQKFLLWTCTRCGYKHTTETNDV